MTLRMRSAAKLLILRNPNFAEIIAIRQIDSCGFTF